MYLNMFELPCCLAQPRKSDVNLASTQGDIVKMAFLAISKIKRSSKKIPARAGRVGPG